MYASTKKLYLGQVVDSRRRDVVHSDVSRARAVGRAAGGRVAAAMPGSRLLPGPRKITPANCDESRDRQASSVPSIAIINQHCSYEHIYDMAWVQRAISATPGVRSGVVCRVRSRTIGAGGGTGAAGSASLSLSAAVCSRDYPGIWEQPLHSDRTFSFWPLCSATSACGVGLLRVWRRGVGVEAAAPACEARASSHNMRM